MSSGTYSDHSSKWVVVGCGSHVPENERIVLLEEFFCFISVQRELNRTAALTLLVLEELDPGRGPTPRAFKAATRGWGSLGAGSSFFTTSVCLLSGGAVSA